MARSEASHDRLRPLDVPTRSSLGVAVERGVQRARGLRAGPCVLALLVLIASAAWADALPAVDELAPDVDRVRVAAGATGTAWLEERWLGRYEIAEVEVRVPTDRGVDRLDHHLRIELLDEDGAWTLASKLHVAAAVFADGGPSGLAGDADAVAFLAERGMTVEQFEFFAQGPAAESVLMMWELQGVDRDDVPAAVLRHLEGEADDALRNHDAGAHGGWRRAIGWAVHVERLPFPVLASGARFALEGDGVVGDAWQIVLRTVAVPDDLGGASLLEMEYAHAW
jgi:hypothetical protein